MIVVFACIVLMGIFKNSRDFVVCDAIYLVLVCCLLYRLIELLFFDYLESVVAF